MFPTLGMIYEELLVHDPFAVCATFRAFNRWVEDDWGFWYRDRIYAAPYLTLADVDWAVEELELAIDRGARMVVMRPAAPTTATGRCSPFDERFDPFWARLDESGLTLVLHAGDGGVSSNGYAPDGFAASFSGAWKPSIKFHAIEQAIKEWLTTLVFENHLVRFPNLRDHVGGERRRVPPRHVPQAPLHCRQDPRVLPRRPDRDPAPQRVDQPVLGGRRHRGGRSHGRSHRVLFGSDWPDLYQVAGYCATACVQTLLNEKSPNASSAPRSTLRFRGTAGTAAGFPNRHQPPRLPWSPSPSP